MIRINDIKSSVDETAQSVAQRTAKRFSIPSDAVWHVAKRAIDARKKNDVCFVWSIEYDLGKGEKAFLARNSMQKNIVQATEAPLAVYPQMQGKALPRVVVVGSGPCGLFAALELARCRIPVTLIERGKCVEERRADIDRFASGGTLDTESNVQFGEGGAGTFSDGKLNTGTHDPRIKRVLKELVENGAPEEILWEAKPHIGTDRLAVTVKQIRKRLLEMGVEIRFSTRLEDVTVKNGKLCAIKINTACGEEELACTHLVLATGHSARDTFEMLLARGVEMRQKPFSIGARIEHLQADINRIQYGSFASRLSAADYKLHTRLADGRGIYTFCMCPGGYVVAAASEKERLVTNGMSLFARDGVNSNAAILVGVDGRDFGSDDVLAGMRFQREIEERAYRAGGGDYRAVVQRLGDFLEGRESREAGKVKPTYRPGVVYGDIRACLPEYVTQSIRMAMTDFDRRMHGWIDPDAIFTAAETRSSSPVQIVRGEDGQSNIEGIYPCGEGAGYAGGIMSAAVDGLRTAEIISKKLHLEVETL